MYGRTELVDDWMWVSVLGWERQDSQGSLHPPLGRCVLRGRPVYACSPSPLSLRRDRQTNSQVTQTRIREACQKGRERPSVSSDANSAHLEIKDDSALLRLSVSYYRLGFRGFVTLTYSSALCLMHGCTPSNQPSSWGIGSEADWTVLVRPPWNIHEGGTWRLVSPSRLLRKSLHVA